MAADTAPNGPEAERGPSLQAMFADDAAPSAANGPSGTSSSIPSVSPSAICFRTTSALP